MSSDRVMMWRFADAPESLRALHTGQAKAPEWLVLIPRHLSGSDLEEAIVLGSEPGHVARYETEQGDIVYVGKSRLNSDLEGIKGMSTMAATHAKRK